MHASSHSNAPFLVIGGTGKTGSRVVERLRRSGHVVRAASRSSDPAFNWDDEETWCANLKGVSAAYMTYAPDLAIPGAAEAIQAFVTEARRQGVQRLVLLSGRGEAEAQACERIVQQSGPEWTIVRSSWFNQNFSEGAFSDMVRKGEITLPAGPVPEPFVDADDIADVVAAALTEDGHDGQIYEVTGPRLMTMSDIAADLSEATGRRIAFQQVPHAAFIDGAARAGAPEEVVWVLDYLFSTVLDGRNAYLTDGIERALGRPPKDFQDYARDAAATGIWTGALNGAG